MMTMMEVNAVIGIFRSTLRAMTLRVTMAIDRPKERAILSMKATSLKKTSVQQKPGREKTRINPAIARKVDNGSRAYRKESGTTSSDGSKLIGYIVLEHAGKFKRITLAPTRALTAVF